MVPKYNVIDNGKLVLEQVYYYIAKKYLKDHPAARMVNSGVKSNPKPVILPNMIKENDKAIIVSKGNDYEVWMKLDAPSGSLIQPSDEDFGVWAWSAYTLDRAYSIFDSITDGSRKITPMVEDKSVVKTK